MSEEQQLHGHGIQSAYYSSDGEQYHPVMYCICGFSTGRCSINWEEAGAEFDEHLKASR